jgi:hypothetical protein
MITRAQVKATMGGILSNIAEIPPNAIRWMDEAQGAVWTDAPALFLRISPIQGQGIDTESIAGEGADDVVVTVDGQRRFTLSIRCESFEQDFASPQHAANVADTLRIRLKRSSTIAQWRGVCALESIQPTKRIDYKSAGRSVSAYAIDLMMRTADQDVDTTAGSGDWIGEAIITGALGPSDPPLVVDLDVDATDA